MGNGSVEVVEVAGKIPGRWPIGDNGGGMGVSLLRRGNQ